MRKFIFATLAICTLLLGATWLHAEVKLIDPEYDFGLVRELSGKQKGSAHLVNYGPDTVVISDVRPSCGCTTADYTEGPILPGDTAVVNFAYDPYMRPGEISKNVKVYIQPSGERFVIKLFGRVLGTPETLSRNYPEECGPMRLSNNLVELKDVKPETGRHAFVRIVNQSMDTITPQWLIEDPALSINVAPPRLSPGEIGSIGIFLNSKFIDKAGDIEYIIPFTTAEDSTQFNLTLRANILPSDTVKNSSKNGTSRKR